jgi:hypothetical protein
MRVEGELVPHRSRTRRPLRTGRVRVAAVAGAVALISSLVSGCTSGRTPSDVTPQTPATEEDGGPLRAFTADSWWNTPVPDDAPANRDGTRILRYLSTAKESGDGCLRLAGTGDNSWGQPVYWAGEGDPEFSVDVAGGPPEVEHLRIPVGAESADNNDGSMSIFDVERGYAVALTGADYHAGSDTWSADGATVTYLDSNGLDVRTGNSSDPRNLGTHRGNNAAVMMARIDEVQAGRIDHVLKIASGPEASTRFVFPMVGSDGDSRRADAPPEGLRMRIKPSIDLGAMDLDKQTLVIVRAMQQYGVYIGDSGSVTALKLEDTVLSRGKQLWHMPPTALCGLPFSPEVWDVLPEGYRPSPG